MACCLLHRRTILPRHLQVHRIVVLSLDSFLGLFLSHSGRRSQLKGRFPKEAPGPHRSSTQAAPGAAEGQGGGGGGGRGRVRVAGTPTCNVCTRFLLDTEDMKKKKVLHALAHLPPSRTPAKEVVKKENISAASLKA